MSNAMTVHTAPDMGLPADFLTATAEILVEAGHDARVDYPGILVFQAHGREWATGYTGLHVCDNEGYGDPLDGDEALIALERGVDLTPREYATALSALIDDVGGHVS